jgi:CBS domain-containing protein
MTEHPVVVEPDTGVRDCTDVYQKEFSSVPVVEGGVMIGIITKTDLMKSALVRQITWPVGDVMEDVPVNRLPFAQPCDFRDARAQ